MNLEESKSIVRDSISEITDGEVQPTDEMNLIGQEAGLVLPHDVLYCGGKISGQTGGFGRVLGRLQLWAWNSFILLRFQGK